MKVIIVDDEPPARREMRRLLVEFPWMEIVGEAGSAAEAEALIEALHPELIFLDIQMPGGSGFDLLARLEHVPQVVFTTAHDEHAVHAFEVSALDYLLKPIDPRRLASTLDRVRRAGRYPLRKAGRYWSSCLFAMGAAAGSCRCAKCNCSHQKAITFACPGER